MKFLHDGKFAIGLFSGIVTCIALAIAFDTFELGKSTLVGAIGVLLGGAIGALPSFYTQWLSYSQIENERLRQHRGRRSALASNLHAKLLRSASHVGHARDLYEKNSMLASAALDKRPSLLFSGVPLKPPDLNITDDELHLALEAIEGEGKLAFLMLQDECNQLFEISNFYTTRRRAAFDSHLSIDASRKTQISYPTDQSSHIDALVHELDSYFDIIAKRSDEVFKRLTKAIIDLTEGFSRMPEIQSNLLRMEINIMPPVLSTQSP